jgi:hypothetical protein
VTDHPDNRQRNDRAALNPILGVMVGVTFGVIAGIAIGISRDNIPLWIGIGLASGVGLGLLVAAIAARRVR